MNKEESKSQTSEPEDGDLDDSVDQVGTPIASKAGKTLNPGSSASVITRTDYSYEDSKRFYTINDTGAISNIEEDIIDININEYKGDVEASKNLPDNKSSIIINDILNHKEILLEEMRTVLDNYKKLIAVDQIQVFQCFEEKYFSYIDRYILKCTKQTRASKLTNEIENKTFESLNDDFDQLRSKIKKFIMKDTTRGLSYLKNYFNSRNFAVFIEEVYDQNGNKSKENGEIGSQENEENYNSSGSFTKQINLIFLLHGYLGKDTDMIKIKNVLTQLIPDAKIHPISGISGRHMTIEEMGELVAEEISLEINRSKLIGDVRKVSFIAYSLGGVVIRAALAYLKSYKDLFHMYISLATPHLGCFYSGNSLLYYGMLVLNGITRDQLLSEIRLTDESDIKETKLYTLSSCKGLDWFKVVVLVGSGQDGYSPLESALIQMSERIGDLNIYPDLK